MCWDVNFYKKQKVQKANSWYLSQICCKTTHTVQTEVWISFSTVALAHLNTEGLYYLMCTQSILFHLPNQQPSCLSSQTCWWTGLTAWGLQFLICILFRVRNESESRGWATFTSATARIWQTKLYDCVCASTSVLLLIWKMKESCCSDLGCALNKWKQTSFARFDFNLILILIC